jgi:hypothetical protein
MTFAILATSRCIWPAPLSISDSSRLVFSATDALARRGRRCSAAAASQDFRDGIWLGEDGVSYHPAGSDLRVH